LILVLPIRTEDHSGGARGFTVSKSKIVGDGKQGAPIVCSATADVRTGAGAAPVSRGVRSLGSTCRRGDVADRRGRATPRQRPQSKQVPPWRPRSSVAESDPTETLAAKFAVMHRQSQLRPRQRAATESQ
jgi:hypothetical protein